MFGSHFYNATLRKAVAVFGTLFNDITVVRKDGSGGILNQIRVPLAYGPKQKFLSRLDQDTMKDASVAIKLPRLSFEITSLDVDSTKKIKKRDKITNPIADSSTKKEVIQTHVPYNIGMQLSIMAKNQDDGLQILEQILPYFQPEYTVSIKPIDGWSNYKQDVPIILSGVNIDDQYDGDYMSRRVLIYTLDFQMKMTFYSGKSEAKLIKTINIDFNQDANGANILEEMDITIDPPTADEDDNYAVNVTIT